MIDILVKDVMIPISRYVTVKKTDTLIDVLQALDKCPKIRSGARPPRCHRGG
jgi:Mg2+/Co2+ transporter CorC